jgi:hypothetical protein
MKPSLMNRLMLLSLMLLPSIPQAQAGEFKGTFALENIYREAGARHSFFLAGLPNSKHCLSSERHRTVCMIEFREASTSETFHGSLRLRIKGLTSLKEERKSNQHSVMRLKLDEASSDGVQSVECWLPSDDRTLTEQDIQEAFGQNLIKL